MAKRKERQFGPVIRERRRQLDLTQQEVAHRIRTSTPYVGHLESGKRHPSDKVLSKLAEVLGLDRRELFFLANPRAVELLRTPAESGKESGWTALRKDERLKRIHNIAADEMDVLGRIAAMGEVGSPRDLIFLLIAMRHVLGR